MFPDDLNKVIIKDFKHFIKERESIRLKRLNGDEWPWTKDRILRDYKFTNVSRNYDQGSLDLIQFTKNMNFEETLYWTSKYRFMCSGSLFFKGVTDILRYPAYQVPRCNKGQKYLDVVKQMCDAIKDNYKLVESCSTMLEIADVLIDITKNNNGSGIMYVFYCNEIAKDMSMLYPHVINPNGECYLGKGAVIGLQAINGNVTKDPTRTIKGNQLRIQHSILKEKIYELMFDDYNFSTIEHALCEYGKYEKIRKFNVGKKRNKKLI